MNTCAITISPNCKGVIYKRGICSNCYKHLIREGIIQDGDSFESFPEWLKDMIRMQDNFDKDEDRHPESSLETLVELEVA